MPQHKQQIRAKFTGQPATQEGKYQILFITEGKANGWTFSRQSLQESAPLWEGASVFVDHAMWGRSVRDLGGVLNAAAWSDEFSGLTAELTPAGPSKEIIIEAARMFLSDQTTPDIGFSADLIFTADAQLNVQKILQPISVDLVVDPAFATKFIRQLNSKGIHTLPPPSPATDRKETMRKKDFKHIPDPPVDDGEEEDGQRTVEAELQQDAITSIREARIAIGAQLLEATLSASELPAKAQAAIRKQFAGKVFKPAELTAAVEGYNDAIAEATAGSQIVGPGRVRSMFDTADQLQAAMDDLVGVPREKGTEKLQIAKLSGVREAYLMLTGDRNFVGGYFPDHVQFQSTTVTFAGLVKNALNKALARHWDLLGRAGYDWWQKIVQVEHFESLNEITWLIFGSVASLPTVAEGAEYTELPIGDSAETSSFVKKGGYIGLTLEAMDRDQTRKLQQIPRELANAGLREISALIAAIFTDNSAVGPTLADTGALFNNVAQTTKGGHKNLLTTALGTDYAAWSAAAMAMYQQPMLVKNEAGYYGAGKQMAIVPKYCLVPLALKGQADALFVPRWASAVQTVPTAGGPTWGGFVEPVVVPEWTDTTDWAAVADPTIAPAIMVGERFGLLPQIFIAGNENDPAMFANDEARIKVRHFIAVGVADFRPLHKSNV
jgi:hypothetical protein